MKSTKEHVVGWDLSLRYRLIETIALWEGRLTANHLINAFGIGRHQASRNINEYIKICPGNLIYDTTLKGYKPDENFRQHFCQGEVDEYLQLLSSRNDPASCFTSLNITAPNTSVLYSPVRTIQPEMIRPVIQASRDQKRLEIEYVSMHTPNSEGRVISPHTIVWSGFRWHVRAFCEQNQDYRDFVLSRITEKPSITLKSANTIAGDRVWNTHVEVVIRPDRRLSGPQRKIIARDYGMRNSRLRIKTRGALVTYMLQTLRIDPHTVQLDPEAQQIEIANMKEIRKWLF